MMVITKQYEFIQHIMFMGTNHRDIIVSSKGDHHLKAQPYTIFTTIIDKIICTHLTEFHKKFTTLSRLSMR